MLGAVLFAGVIIALNWWFSRRDASVAVITHDFKPDYDSMLRNQGAKVDDALYTYAQLLENGCHENLILEIARERIERLRREFEDLELRKLESVTK